MEGRQYKAFLSYSHADGAIARRLHRELETYRLESRLVHLFGIAFDAGPLYPIFRDEDELAASADLGADIRAALEASDSLIVLCSPSAAQSRWVNEEVLAFKRLGRENRVFALIIDGEPGGAAECFPHALRFRLGGDGQLTEEQAEPIAADIRPGRQSFEEAKSKLVAGLLKVPLNDLRQRELTLERRQRRFYQALAGLMLLLAVAAVTAGAIAMRYADLSEKRFRQALGISSGLVEEATTLSDRFGIPTSAVESMLARSSGFFDLLQQDEQGDPQLKLSRGALLLRYADSYSRLGNFAMMEKSARAAKRALEALAAETEGGEADVLVLRAMSYVADALVGQQHLATAEQELRARLVAAEGLAISSGRSAESVRELAISQHKLSVVLLKRMQFEAAAAFAAAASRSIAEGLRLDPANPILQRDQAVILEQQGDALAEFGRLTEAVSAYEQAYAQRSALSTRFAGNTEYLRDVGLISRKLGRAFLSQSQFAKALKSFEASVAAFDVLSASDARNSVWRSDLALSYAHVGSVLERTGRLRDAVERYRAADGIYAGLLRDDANNFQWLEERAGVKRELADALMRAGRISEGAGVAIESLKVKLSLARARPSDDRFKADALDYGTRVGDELLGRNARLTLRVYSALMPECAEWATEHSGKWAEYGAKCFEMLGEANRLIGNAAVALGHYRASLAAREELVRARRESPESVYKLSVAEYNLGLCFAALGRKREAETGFKKSHESNALAGRLATDDPELQQLVKQHTADIAGQLRLLARRSAVARRR